MSSRRTTSASLPVASASGFGAASAAAASATASQQDDFLETIIASTTTRPKSQTLDSHRFIEERQRAREEIKRRQIEELERQKRELEAQQALIMAEKSEIDEYVERIKYCYKTINRIMKMIKEEKYIITGVDPAGATIRGSSRQLISQDFDISNANNLIYYYTHSLASSDIFSRVAIPKIKMQYGSGYSFCQTNGFTTSIGNHGREYNPATQLSFFTAIKIFSQIPGRSGYQWDGETIERIKDSVVPSVYQWILKNSAITTPKTHRGAGCCSTNQGYTTQYSFGSITFSLLEGQTMCSHQGGGLSGIDTSGYSKIQPSRKIYLTYLMDEHETMRPHSEFIKKPEHKYTVCQMLIELLENMTEKYYIMGKMELVDLEFVEKSIMEFQQ